MNKLFFSIVATGAIVLFITIVTPRIVSAVIAQHSFPGWPHIDAVIECGSLEDYRKHCESIKKNAPWVRKIFVLANPVTTKSILEHDKSAQVFSNSYEIVHYSDISQYFLYFRENSVLNKPIIPKDYLYYVDVKIPYGIIQYTKKGDKVLEDETIMELFEEHPEFYIDPLKPQIHFKENYKILFEKMVSEKIKPETVEVYTHLTSETLKKV